MRPNKYLLTFMIFFVYTTTTHAQDNPPTPTAVGEELKTVLPLTAIQLPDSVHVTIQWPSAFRSIGENTIVDPKGILIPVLDHLRLLRTNGRWDTLHVVHIGDSHVRGRFFPQMTGTLLRTDFGAIDYKPLGINGATCLTFTHGGRIEDILKCKPDLLIMSFGTNEANGRGYQTTAHYRQMDELISILRQAMPNVPILLTTPPGAYESFGRRRRRSYSVNKRTEAVANVIRKYATDHGLAYWDLYTLAGGAKRAAVNWKESQLLRPDHVHFQIAGYELQGQLLYQALMNYYNAFITY